MPSSTVRRTASVLAGLALVAGPVAAFADDDGPVDQVVTSVEETRDEVRDTVRDSFVGNLLDQTTGNLLDQGPGNLLTPGGDRSEDGAEEDGPSDGSGAVEELVDDVRERVPGNLLDNPVEAVREQLPGNLLEHVPGNLLGEDPGLPVQAPTID